MRWVLSHFCLFSPRPLKSKLIIQEIRMSARFLAPPPSRVIDRGPWRAS